MFGGAVNSPASHMLLQPNKYVCLCPLISDATLPRSSKGVQINSFSVNGLLKYDIATLSVERTGRGGEAMGGGAHDGQRQRGDGPVVVKSDLKLQVQKVDQ